MCSNCILIRDERRDAGRGFHGSFDLFGPHNIFPQLASRRESVDSSEENDDSKDAHESPLGGYIKS